MGLIAGEGWAIALLPVAGSVLALLMLARLAPWLPVDRPGPRSLHERPVSRVGGLAIWAGALPVALLAPPALPGSPAAWLFAWALVAAISLVDDFRGVHPVWRLASQTVAALAVAVAVGAPGPGAPDPALPAYVVTALAALAVVWAANLYNFMDGSDGLAALMGTCGFAAYGVAAWQAGEGALLSICFDRAAALAPRHHLVQVLASVCYNLLPPQLWDEMRSGPGAHLA